MEYSMGTLKCRQLPLVAWALFPGAVSMTCVTAQDDASSSMVYFHCDFESAQWWREWGLRESPQRVDVVGNDREREFQPRDGKALRVRIDQGGHYGVSMQYNFAKRLGSEPEHVYLRYFLRLADDWNPRRGGKLPGIAGTYGRAGWGGRKVNGTDGWSARGLFLGKVNGRTPIGFYCYHADMRGKYGANRLPRGSRLTYIYQTDILSAHGHKTEDAVRNPRAT